MRFESSSLNILTGANLEAVEPHDLERLRRSIAVLSPGVQISGVSREDALIPAKATTPLRRTATTTVASSRGEIIKVLQEAKTETKRYREAVGHLRRVLAALEKL